MDLFQFLHFLLKGRNSKSTKEFNKSLYNTKHNEGITFNFLSLSTHHSVSCVACFANRQQILTTFPCLLILLYALKPGVWEGSLAPRSLSVDGCSEVPWAHAIPFLPQLAELDFGVWSCFPDGSHLNFLLFWSRKSYTRLWWSRGWPAQSRFRVGTALLTHLELAVLFLLSLCLDNLPSSADSIAHFSS